MTKQIRFIDDDGVELEIGDAGAGVAARIILRNDEDPALMFDADSDDLEDIIAMLNERLAAS